MQLVIRLETNYELWGETSGFSNKWKDVPWNKRSQKERALMSHQIRWKEVLWVEDIAQWIFASIPVRSQCTSFRLVTSLDHPPEWHIDVAWELSCGKHTLKREIRNNFRHYYRAGDVNYTIKTIRYVK